MKKLAWTTVVFTYILMVWGNIVSATGSGLACPDWPLCHGTVTPPIRFDIVLEWGHRILAFTASVLIVTTLFKVFTSREKHHQALRQAGKTLLMMLAFQIVLGGITVMLHLPFWTSTLHLAIASVVFAGLITIACVSTWNTPQLENVSDKAKRLIFAGIIGMAVQMILGGLVRHHHSGLACPNFPNCLNSFLPIPLTVDTALAFIHRWWGVLMLGLFVHLARVVPRQAPKLSFFSGQVLALSIGQVLLGIGTVLSGLHTHSRAFHAGLGYLLWGILCYMGIRAGLFRRVWEPKETVATSRVTTASTATT